MVKGIPFYAAYLAPILIVVTCNLIILALVLRSLLKKSSVTKDKQMDVATKVRITAACSVLMGVTWIVGLFAVEELTLTFQIVFCVFNSLQGFFIFVFYCARNKDVLREWKRCFGCRSEEYSSTSGAQRRGYNTNSKSYTNKMYTNQSEKRRTYLTDDSVPLSSFGGSRPASTASYPTYSTVISNSYSEPEKPLINLNNSSPAKEPEKSSTSTDLIKIELTRIADPYNPETPRPVSGEGYDDMKFFMKKDFSSQSIATIFTEETRDIGAFENQTLENEESVSGRRKDSDADSGISNEGKETAPGSEMSTAL